jgi:hypothetical protein
MGYLRREGMVVGNGLGVGRESRVSTRRRMAELTALSAYSDKVTAAHRSTVLSRRALIS